MGQRITSDRQPAKKNRSFTLVVSLKDFKAKVFKKLKTFAFQTILVEAFNKVYKEKKKSNVAIIKIAKSNNLKKALFWPRKSIPRSFRIKRRGRRGK